MDKKAPDARNGAKKRKVQTVEKQNKRPRMQNIAVGLVEIHKLLAEHEAVALDTCADTSRTSVWLALNVVLDHSTFQKTLLEHDMSRKTEDNVVPVISRQYEESFMRECVLPTDVPCSMGQYCECNFIDSEHAFVGVAFVMPELGAQETKMCILCLRKLTQMLFYRVIDAGYSSTQVMQTYGNQCDVPGEYHSSAMLVMPTHGPVHCMPLPVVAHQRNKYYVVLQDGHRHLKQRNVYVEDFH